MIIIKTPQPDTEERLVLVPTSTVNFACMRAATPDDLARAGYVPSVGYLPRREVETAVSDAMDLQRRLVDAEAHAAELHGRCETLRVERNAAQGRAEKAEAALRMSVTPAHAETIDRAEKAERERDDLLARINDAEHEARTLRAELARIKPDGVDEPLDVELGDMFAQARRDNESGRQRHVVSPLRVVYRLGVAHERARVAAFLLREAAGTITCSGMALRQAVADLGGDLAARVRQECLVAQAVGMGVSIRAVNERDGRWFVEAKDHSSVVPPADVPATLARLLGEVAR